MADGTDNKGLFYATGGVVSRHITVSEWDQLCSMFASDGWALWMDLKGGDVLVSIEDMGADATEATSAAYRLLMQDVTAETRLRYAVARSKPVPKSELDGAYSPDDDPERGALAQMFAALCDKWTKRS